MFLCYRKSIYLCYFILFYFYIYISFFWGCFFVGLFSALLLFIQEQLITRGYSLFECLAIIYIMNVCTA
ncbi:hypothetical protein C1645_747462 [Glomus cerebriforme]|uniref:Uncharacterized protein n=1 Tax=Glomus cerebriforme TaxID=658196 RepID=A0A397TN18_9GLOM|nr:hypothetical protein C1645_747462 [Glomus cerebriforme]